MHAIKETKELLQLVFGLVKAVESSMADGKLGLDDAGELLKLFPLVGPALENVSEVPKELKDLDEAEAAELLSWAKAQFDLVDDALESKIEKGLAIAYAIADILELFKK